MLKLERVMSATQYSLEKSGRAASGLGATAADLLGCAIDRESANPPRPQESCHRAAVSHVGRLAT